MVKEFYYVKGENDAEYIKLLKKHLEENKKMLEKALKKIKELSKQNPKWIPVSWHKITEEERIENGYPEDWDMLMDCEMPTDNEEILVTTRYGTVEQDLSFYEDGIYYLDSGYDWILDVVAWMSSPEPYNESEGQNANRNQIGR